MTIFIPPFFSARKPVVKMVKIIGARLTDLFLWLILVFPFYFSTLHLQPRWGYILGANLFFLAFFLLLFTVLPYFWKGQTIGRRLFKITLTSKTATRLPWHYFFFREGFIVLFPYLVIAGYLSLVQLWFPAFFPRAFSVVLLLPFWFLFLFFFQKFNPDQQIFIDRYYQVWLVDHAARSFVASSISTVSKAIKVK